MTKPPKEAPESPQIDDREDPKPLVPEVVKKASDAILRAPKGKGAMLRRLKLPATDPAETPASPQEIERAGAKEPLQPLGIREEAFLAALPLHGWDAYKAAESAGYPGRLGKQLLEKPYIRARLAHAVSESWMTPEAIMARLGELCFGPNMDPRVTVKALELALKSRGLIDVAQKGTDMPRSMAEVDQMLAAELRRVKGDGGLQVDISALLTRLTGDQPQIANQTTENKALPTDTPQNHIQEDIDTPTTRSSESSKREKATANGLSLTRGSGLREDVCRRGHHLRVRVRADGWLCERCGKWGQHGKGRASTEAQLVAHGYRDAGDDLWIAP